MVGMLNAKCGKYRLYYNEGTLIEEHSNENIFKDLFNNFCMSSNPI